MAEPEGTGSLEPLVGFGRMLRQQGLPVGTGRIVTFCRAAAALRPLDRDRLYWAGRASLVGRPEDFDAYDDVFERWFGTHGRAALEIELNLPQADRGRARWSGTEADVRLSRVAGSWSAAGDEEPEPGDEAALRLVASAEET